MNIDEFPCPTLHAVVHVEFDGVGGHAETRDFFFLERDIGIEHIVAEHAALGEESAILVEVFQGFIKRSAWMRNLRGLRSFEIVQVLVHGLPGIDLVLNSIQPGHHHGRESEIGICSRIREPH